MIKPYGSDILNPLFIEDEELRKMKMAEAEKLPSVQISSAAAGNAVMLGAGYFNPLTGYMNLTDTLRVAERMQTADGLFWPTPVVNMIKEHSLSDDVRTAKRIALRDPNVEGNPIIAIQQVDAIEEMTDAQIEYICSKVYGTTEHEHPGVANFIAAGDTLISGAIEVLNYSYFEKDFEGTFMTAPQIREKISGNGWNKVVAFQTRNPMHRAHEELTKMAFKAEEADGILIHMLLGKLKKGDIPADVRDNAIRTMVDKYFPENTVIVSGYGFDMLYAGPREAVLHALFRQNAGCTHLIVGRDHAGVGDYYGDFEAQEIFDAVPAGAMQIDVFKGDHTVWCKKCDGIVMIRDCPHEKEDYIMLSGTKVRGMLSKGEPLPPEFSRPEVAKILTEYYQSL